MSLVYLWLDLETTGLHVETDVILEVAWLLTDPNLIPLHDDVTMMVVDHDAIRLSPFVARMHAHSGLLDAMGGPVSDLETIEATILDYLPPADVDVQLAGSGVHFDKAFLAHHMPRLHSRLHYRIMDVSVVRRFMSDVCGVEFPRTEVTHRAADDVRQTLEEAHRLRAVVTS